MSAAVVFLGGVMAGACLGVVLMAALYMLRNPDDQGGNE